MTISQVAEREGLSVQYAAKMLHYLRKAGFIKSIRGMKGGVMLARPAADISVWEVLVGLSGGIYDGHFCGTFTGVKDVCVHKGNCGIRPVWASVVGHVQGALSRMSLAELLHDEREASHEVQQHFQEELLHPRSYESIPLASGRRA